MVVSQDDTAKPRQTDCAERCARQIQLAAARRFLSSFYQIRSQQCVCAQTHSVSKPTFYNSTSSRHRRSKHAAGHFVQIALYSRQFLGEFTERCLCTRLRTTKSVAARWVHSSVRLSTRSLCSRIDMRICHGRRQRRRPVGRPKSGRRRRLSCSVVMPGATVNVVLCTHFDSFGGGRARSAPVGPCALLHLSQS